MRPNLGRLIAPALLLAALTLPLAMTEAQPGRRKKGRAARQTQTTGATETPAQSSTDQSQKPGPGRRSRQGLESATTTQGQQNLSGGRMVRAQRVLRRVNQATAPKAVVDAIRSKPEMLAALAIKGNLISPRPGHSLWQMTNGGYFIYGGEATLSAVQTIIRKFPDGSYIFLRCSCTGGDQEDPCEFDNPGNPQNPGKCRNAECCKIYQGGVDADGTPLYAGL